MPDDIPMVVRGVCSVSFAYDAGFAIDLDHAERLVRHHAQRETIRRTQRAPNYIAFDPAPLLVSADAPPIALGGFATSPGVECVLFDFGAVGVTYSIPIAGPLASLLNLSVELERGPLPEDARRRLDELLAAVAPAVAKLGVAPFVEDYAVFRVEAIEPALPPARLLDSHAELVARILRGEPGPLSADEVRDALECRISYSTDDLALIDWNAALLVMRDADDVEAVLRYANVELLEMRVLDDFLDDALEDSYRAMLRDNWRRALPLGLGRRDLQRIARFQMDSAALFEGVNNALKLVGDQYLARLYRLAAQRLHLPAWDASILRKISTLDSLYQKLTDRQAARRMEVLEWIIIVLIAASIVMPFVPGLAGKP